MAFALAALAAGGSMARAAALDGCCSIALGFEPSAGGSQVTPVGLIVVRDIEFTNQRTSKATFVINRTTSPATLSVNRLVGSVTPLSGNGSANGTINGGSVSGVSVA